MAELAVGIYSNVSEMIYCVARINRWLCDRIRFFYL